jgi:ubiquinone/menaquinone biosynthesis C-methylase UbiE
MMGCAELGIKSKFNYYKKNNLLRYLFQLPLKKIGRKILKQQSSLFTNNVSLFSNKKVLEVGGPSSNYGSNGLFPIYNVSTVDIIDYSKDTIWNQYIPQKMSNNRIVMAQEVTALDSIEDNSYECIISSHVIQHTANPILALHEFKRVLDKNGTICIIVPYKKYTFDHLRPITTLSHMVQDFKKHSNENDQTHFSEASLLHDVQRDDGVIDIDHYKNRLDKNIENRALHHHVFDTENIAELLTHVGFNIIGMELWFPYDIVCICDLNYIKGINSQYFENVVYKAKGGYFRMPNYPVVK